MQLVLEGVAHYFDEMHPLFTNVNRVIGKGKIVALTGPSGSGKSTLLNLMAGWEPCRSGEIFYTAAEQSVEGGNPKAAVGPEEGEGLLVDGRQPAPETARLKPKISWVFQNPHGVAHREAIDHVVLPILARGVARKAAEEQAQELLKNFHLEHSKDKLFSELSGGQAQRLMLARAMATVFDVLLVDEPTAQLDRHSAENVNRTLRQLVSDKIVVIATHDARTVEVCDEVLDLEQYQ